MAKKTERPGEPDRPAERTFLNTLTNYGLPTFEIVAVVPSNFVRLTLNGSL